MKSTGRFTPALRKLTHYSYDHCSQCGASLQKGVAAYAGYTAAGAEIYVGKCCQALISELASHIYWWWSTYKRPIPEAALWRYMDFTKFVALLKDNALYFARADHLGDPFEGARGLAEREAELEGSLPRIFSRSDPNGSWTNGSALSGTYRRGRRTALS